MILIEKAAVDRQRLFWSTFSGAARSPAFRRETPMLFKARATLGLLLPCLSRRIASLLVVRPLGARAGPFPPASRLGTVLSHAGALVASRAEDAAADRERSAAAFLSVCSNLLRCRRGQRPASSIACAADPLSRPRQTSSSDPASFCSRGVPGGLGVPALGPQRPGEQAERVGDLPRSSPRRRSASARDGRGPRPLRPLARVRCRCARSVSEHAGLDPVGWPANAPVDLPLRLLERVDERDPAGPGAARDRRRRRSFENLVDRGGARRFVLCAVALAPDPSRLDRRDDGARGEQDEDRCRKTGDYAVPRETPRGQQVRGVGGWARISVWFREQQRSMPSASASAPRRSADRESPVRVLCRRSFWRSASTR